MSESRDQALAHLRLICSRSGFWEIRSLQRLETTTMSARGSFFIIATSTRDGLIYDRLEQAIEWADHQARTGAELFLGMNPRAREGRDKAAVERVTACYVDLDLPEGETQESVLEELRGFEPLPSLVVNSGYGLHAVWLLTESSSDKALWLRVQKGLTAKLADLGADRSVTTDESRVLRLVPYRNRKKWPHGIETSILDQTEARYAIDALAEVVSKGTSYSPREVLDHVPEPPPIDGAAQGELSRPVDGDSMTQMALRAEGARAALEAWIKRNLKRGLHYGLIPIEGGPASEATRSNLSPG